MAFFFSVGVIFFEIRSGAAPAVVDFTDSCFGSLAADFSGKVDFVVRWADAWGDLHDEVLRIGSGGRADGSDGFWNDAKLCSLAPRVCESDATPVTVGDIDGGAVRHIDAKAEVALRGDESIAIGNRKGVGAGNAHNIGTVNLAGLRKGHPGKPCFTQGLALNAGETLQRGFAVGFHIQPRHTLQKNRPNRRESI